MKWRNSRIQRLLQNPNSWSSFKIFFIKLNDLRKFHSEWMFVMQLWFLSREIFKTSFSIQCEHNTQKNAQKVGKPKWRKLILRESADGWHCHRTPIKEQCTMSHSELSTMAFVCCSPDCCWNEEKKSRKNKKVDSSTHDDRNIWYETKVIIASNESNFAYGATKIN